MSIDADPSRMMTPCPACGAEHRSASKFCRECGGRLGGPPAGTCQACGTENRAGARFCRACGAQLGEAARPSPAPAAPDDVAKTDSGEPIFGAFQVVQPRARRPGASAIVKRPAFLAVAVVAAAAGVAALAFALMHRPPAAAAAVTEYATRLVRVRSAIGVASSTVLGDLRRGDAISGTWVTGQDGLTKWLKIKWGGRGDGFVWSRNLSDRPRPGLTASPTPSQSVLVAGPVRGEPDENTPIIDTVFAGQSAQTVGNTLDGWVEIALAGGGVGYVKAETFQVASTPPPPPPPSLNETPDAGGTAPMSANPAAAPTQPSPPLTAPAPPALGPPRSAPAATRYACAFAPGQSINAPQGTGGLSFFVDEARACINNRSAYLRNPAGGLKRTMLSDKDRRASVLYFSPDRSTFFRMDYTLPPEAYARVRQAGSALVDIACPGAGDMRAAAAIRATLAGSTPNLSLRSLPAGATWRRMVWRCAPAS